MLISVIIPVHQDIDGLGTTVRSLLDQDLPADRYEILVVDNNSGDGTLDAARRFEAEHPGRVRALEETSIQSSYAARNTGFAAAQGEILCFVDADMWIPPEYLSAVARAFEDPEHHYLGCSVRIVDETGTLAALHDQIHGFPIEGYLERLHYAPTCCMSVRRSVLDAVGLFDDGLASSGDLEFGARVHDRGFAQHLLPGVELRHPARSTGRALRAKRRRVARGHAELRHRHPGRFDFFHHSYRWRRLIRRPPTPGSLRARARNRGHGISWARATALALLSLRLDLIGTYNYRRAARRLGLRAPRQN